MDNFLRKAALIISVALLACTIRAAHLGFEGPQKSLKPGETFNVSLQVLFDQADIDPARPAPTVKVNIVWPEGISITESPAWNTDVFSFSDTFFEQSATTAYLWATATPDLNKIQPGEDISIATVSCLVIDEVDDEPFYYEMYDDISYATAVTDHNGIDILGDPDDDEDGTDELLIYVSDIPSYIAVIRPRSPSVPFTIQPVPVDLTVTRAVSDPAPYDHVRFVLEYDSTVISCNPQSLTNALPSFFNTITSGLIQTNYIEDTGSGIVTNSFELGAFIEAYCSPTNYEGTVFTLLMTAHDIDDSIDIEFVLGDRLQDTVIERSNADLLGHIYYEDDGVQNGLLNIRYVDGLVLSLDPGGSIIPVSNTAVVRLVMQKDCNDTTLFDYAGIELLFNTNLIEYGSFTFEPNPAVLGEDVLLTQTLGTNTYGYIPDVTNRYHHSAVNASFFLEAEFENPVFLASNITELGTISFNPVRPGTLGLHCDYTSIEYSLSDIIDFNAQQAEWPVTITALSDEEIASQFTVTLSPSTTVNPGTEFSLKATAVGAVITGAQGQIVWLYDDTVLTYLGDDAGMAVTGTVSLLDGETAAGLFLPLNDFTTASRTTELASVRFRSEEPDTAVFTPVTPELSDNYSILTRSGSDMLGARQVEGDGVSGCTIIIKEPDDVFLSLEPLEPLFAGKPGRIGLTIRNPRAMPWNEAGITVVLDPEDVIMLSDAWTVTYLGTVTILENDVTPDYPEVTGYTNEYGIVITNSIIRSSLKFRISPAVTNDIVIAELNVIALREEPIYYIETDDGETEYSETYVRYNDMLLLNEDTIQEEDWTVYPCGMYIWLDGPEDPPILGSNYYLTAKIHNPHNMEVSGTRICWSFDSTMLKVSSFKLADEFTGTNIWINNFNDGDGYICAELQSSAVLTNSEIAICTFSIYPQVSDIIEIYPDEDVFYDGPDIMMDVYGQHGFNYLETMDEWPTDLCPIWRRGVVWFDIPQLVFDDLELDRNEVYILDLHWEGEGLANYKSNTVYHWWTEGAEHVDIQFNSLAGTARVIPELNWTGEEIIQVYCRENGSPFTGTSPLRVVVGDSLEPELEIHLVRDEYLTVTDYVFNELTFTLKNATSNTVVSAVILVNGVTNQADVINLDTGDRGTDVPVLRHGRLSWVTPSERGYHLCRITAVTRNAAGLPIDTASEYAYIEIDHANRDWDGDRFFLLYNRKPIPAPGRVVKIENGSDSDKLVMKVFKDKDGDGLVALDSIISDHGFKKLSLRGSIHYIETGGPIGSLHVKGGIVGRVVIKRGGLGTMKIKTLWDPYWEEFTEVGCIYGVTAPGSIGTISIKGGSIGDEDEPAIIESVNGSIKAVVTKLAKKKYMDTGDVYIEVAGYEGANIYASILAKKGSIGNVIAVGGSVGAMHDYSRSELQSHFGIRQVTAKAVKGDYEILGGFIHSDMHTKGAVKKINAIGGDISGSEDIDGDDIDELIEYPVTITAQEIKKIQAKAKIHFYSDPDPDFWEWELRGGNVGIYADITGSMGSIQAKGGNICTYLHTCGDIQSISAKTTMFREDKDSYRERIGGFMTHSIVLPDVEYMSQNSYEYRGTIRKLIMDRDIRESWIGTRGPIAPNQFQYRRLDGSEIWINGDRAY
jgi:hypothetical protein